MNARAITIWFLLVITLFGLLSLYGIENTAGTTIEWADRVTLLLPGMIILLGFISWATKTEKHRAWKVVGGIAVSGATCLLLWYKYFKELGEAIDHAKENIETGLYLIIGIGVIALALLTYRKKN